MSMRSEGSSRRLMSVARCSWKLGLEFFMQHGGVLYVHVVLLNVGVTQQRARGT